MAKKEKPATSDDKSGSGAAPTSTDSGASRSTDTIKSNDLLPKPKDIETLQHFFGKRELVPFDNSEILRCRLLCQVESSKIHDCYDVANKDTGKVLGTVPKLQLAHSWRMAHSKYAQKVVQNKLFFMKESEWASDVAKIEAYVRSKRVSSDRTKPVFFSDVWQLSEIEYESLGLDRPQQFMALLQTALLGEMEENRCLIAAWHKIKKYIHKVPLESSEGGIFSNSDADKLRATLNIKHLNDLRKLNILVVKNAALDFDFAEIVDDINAAFKEDLARRIDKRFKVLPFVAAFTNLAIIITRAFTRKYTLIKDSESTMIIMALLTLCVVDALAVFVGGLRAKRRRRKRYDYVYYSQKVRKAVRNFALIGVFALLSVFNFYQRYDGYNDQVYYRDLDDGTVAIAGLFDKEITKLSVPYSIDNKVVSEVGNKAFKKSDLTSVTLPSSTTKIGKKAFLKCSSLESISIPDKVESIGKSAFEKCTYLESITLPDKVTEIPDKAFKNSGIETITVGKSGLVRIGDEAFYGCYSLKVIPISEGLVEVGKKAFMKCSGITSIHLPGSVEKIGEKALYYCEGLTTISIPYAGTSAEQSKKQSVSKIIKFQYPSGMDIDVTITSGTDIGSKAFKKITWIASITLDDRITSIAEGAFAEASNLRTVKMPAGITEIYASMFEGAYSLRTVKGMINVTSVGSKAFYGCSYLQEVEFGELTSIGESAFEGCSAIAKLGNLSKVKTIGARAFYDCNSITSVEDLASLETIGSRAFESCNGLTVFIFHPSLTTIGEFAFAYCDKMEEVDLSATAVTSMGASVFSDCSTLYRAALSTKMEHIPSRTFYNCRSFDSIASITNISSIELTQIGTSAFENCDTRDYDLVIPSTVKVIGERAFANNKMETVRVPDSVTQIGEGAFDACSNLYAASVPFLGNKPTSTDAGYKFTFGSTKVTTLALTNSTTVTAKTFDGSKDFIESISINEGVARIENGAFKGYTKLYSVNLPSTITVIGESAFEGCRSLYSINLPTALTTIAARAFKSCSNIAINGSSLRDLSLTSIGDEAFSGTGMSGSLSFNSALVSIGKNAFANCSITNIRINSTMKKVDKDAFGKNPDIQVLVTDEELFDYYEKLFEDYKDVYVTKI